MDQKTELEKALNAFMTYEDYLDSMLTKDDLMFLEDKDMCRELLMLGYHSHKRIIPRGVFEQKKAERAEKNKENQIKELRVRSKGIDEYPDKLIEALAKREEDNLIGCIATLIFLRVINEKGEEISSYIDYTHRLKMENWEAYFNGKKKLTPKETDLSFYNWVNETSTHNSSPNFEVIPDTNSLQLIFICNNDGYALDPNSKFEKNENVFRVDIYDSNYEQAVIFDHIVDKPVPL